jgi:hypothetical protein
MIKMTMLFLGKESRTSGKTGNAYFIAKFLNKSTGEIFEFYVKGDNAEVVTMISAVEVAQDCDVALKLVSNRGKAELNLAGVMAK